MGNDPNLSFHTFILDGGKAGESGWGQDDLTPSPYNPDTCAACGKPLEGRKFAKLTAFNRPTVYYHVACLRFESLIDHTGADVTDSINKKLEEMETNDLHA